jgi:hypothetical protein
LLACKIIIVSFYLTFDKLTIEEKAKR